MYVITKKKSKTRESSIKKLENNLLYLTIHHIVYETSVE